MHTPKNKKILCTHPKLEAPQKQTYFKNVSNAYDVEC